MAQHRKKNIVLLKRGGPRLIHLGRGGCKKRRPWSNLLTIEYLVVSYTPLVSRSRFKLFSSDFDGGGGSSFSTFGGWGYRNRRLWSSSLISEGPVVSYTS